MLQNENINLSFLIAYCVTICVQITENIKNGIAYSNLEVF